MGRLGAVRGWNGSSRTVVTILRPFCEVLDGALETTVGHSRNHAGSISMDSRLTHHYAERAAQSCGAAGADIEPAPPALTAGHWGGPVCVEVLASEIDVTGQCAFGSFARPAAVDPDGHFETDGKWLAGVGPVILPGGEPAHLSGLVQGTKLTVIVQTATATMGPEVVEYGATTPCPVPCP
jgi:hypothetical protein